MTKIAKFLGAALLHAAAIAAPAAAATNAVEKTLANGLRVIVVEDRRAPVAVHMVWYRVGAMDETDGTSGVAHLLEHMMFKGTRRLKPGEFSERVSAAGGRDNAFTSLDYTAYFQIVPAPRLAEMMSIEADRMANLRLDPKEFASELKVVMEERRLRTEDQPQARVHEALMSAAWQAHPYRRPIIGWMNDLENMTVGDARDWYRRWYVPNNAWLVVVGDVDAAQVFRLAEKTYGRIPRRALPVRKPPAEPAQSGPRQVSVKAPAKLPYLAMGYKVPVLRDAERDREPYALEVLAGVLDGHDAARLSKNVVRGRKLAVSAGAGYESSVRGESLFVLDGSPAEGHSVEELQAALREEIGLIAREGVPEDELKRVKTQAIASQVYRRDSSMAQAMEIGRTEAAGHSWRDIDRMIEKIRAVTAKEVQAVARKYFTDDGLTVAVLDPQPLPAAPRAAAAPARHTAR